MVGFRQESKPAKSRFVKQCGNWNCGLCGRAVTFSGGSAYREFCCATCSTCSCRKIAPGITCLVPCQEYTKYTCGYCRYLAERLCETFGGISTLHDSCLACIPNIVNGAPSSSLRCSWLKPDAVWQREKINQRKQDQTIAPTSFLWSPYYPNRYYFEVNSCESVVIKRVPPYLMAPKIRTWLSTHHDSRLWGIC